MKSGWFVVSVFLAVAGIVNISIQVGRYERDFIESLAAKMAPAISDRVAGYIEGDLQLQLDDQFIEHNQQIAKLKSEHTLIFNQHALIKRKIEKMD